MIMCIGSTLPWYANYHYVLVLLVLAGCALIGVVLVRSLLKVKQRTAMHYVAALAGMVFLLLLVFIVWVLTQPSLYATKCV